MATMDRIKRRPNYKLARTECLAIKIKLLSRLNCGPQMGDQLITDEFDTRCIEGLEAIPMSVHRFALF